MEATIQSVLGQDYPRLEYIVVDGGSTDGSVEIIQKYAHHLAWWVSERDSGQAEAINKGLSRARGEIVAWLNSDDLYLPGALSAAAQALSAQPDLAFVFGEAISIDPQGRPLHRFRFQDWGLLDLVSFRVICQPAVFIRRAALEQAGYLDLDYHYMLDHRLWVRLARLGAVRRMPALWAAARHHPGAKNVSQAPGFGRETLRLLDWMLTQPDLDALIRANRRKVFAGAQRLNARYLLDGGLYAESLQAYLCALLQDPAYTLRHAARMAYAALCLLGGKRLADRLARRRAAPPPDLSSLPGITSWPGILSMPSD
ncbi:MAG: glycosyltransferase [Chloroflexi bacterium]|nr:glycosyltransferase [Chloroflexota bacterium]